MELLVLAVCLNCVLTSTSPCLRFDRGNGSIDMYDKLTSLASHIISCDSYICFYFYSTVYTFLSPADTFYLLDIMANEFSWTACSGHIQPEV